MNAESSNQYCQNLRAPTEHAIRRVRRQIGVGHGQVGRAFNGAVGLVALALFLGVAGHFALLGQSVPFQLISTNSAPSLLQGNAVWLDTNAAVLASRPINWGGGVLEVDLGTNSNPYSDGFALWPVDTNLTVQGDQLLYQGVSVGTVLERSWYPSSYLGRLNTNGGLDTSFAAPADLEVTCLALQPDGKMLVGGAFGTLAGQRRSNIARLNVDGTLDSTFNPGAADLAGGYSEVFTLSVQQDGKILVGGYFTSLAGQPRSHLGRLNADGTLDTQFNPGAGRISGNYAEVDKLIQDSSGRIVVGGLFEVLAGQSRTNLGRLNADGTLDPLFNPAAEGYRVDTLALQNNGQILVGGSFDVLAGAPRRNLGRLNVDNSLDTTFNPGTFNLTSDDEVFSLVALPGLVGTEPILVGGAFSRLAGQPRICLGELKPEGGLDTNFDAGLQGPLAGQKVSAIVVQADGKILIGGQFSGLAGQQRDNIARLNAYGSLDGNFNPGVRTPASIGSSIAQVNAMLVQPDGKIVVGGQFLELGQPRLRIRFGPAASTAAVNATLRAVTCTNYLAVRTLDALAQPRPALGVGITLTDGDGNLQTAVKSIAFSYLVDLKFEPSEAFVTGTVDAQSVLMCALNNDPNTFLTLDGYDLASPISECGSSFAPANQTLYIGTSEVNADSVCQVNLRVGTITAQLTVNRLAEEQCAVDLFQGITDLQNHALTRARKKVLTTDLVSAANFRALEGLMNQTIEGRRLANLYRQNTAELVGIMLRNPPLLLDSLKLVQAFQPGVASLLAGDGRTAQISAAMVRQVQTLASQFASLGSTNLRAAIQGETTRLNNFSGFIGQDFTGWAGTLGVSIPTNVWVQLNQVRQTNGQFTVQANGVDGLDYSLWRTTDVAGSPWARLTNAAMSRNGFTLELTDPTPLPSRAFYRVTSVPLLPVLLNVPYPSSVSEGANASFSISASGFHLAYQWQFNGEDIAGASDASLALTQVSRCQAGLYTVEVSNGGGVVTSAPALLMVAPQSFDLVTNGLLAHLPLDGDYRDASGHGFDAAPVGTPTLTSGKVGSGAFHFATALDGSSFNYASLGTNVVKQIATNDFSVAFWVNLTNLSADVPLLANQDLRNPTNAGFGLIAGRYGYLIFTMTDGAGVTASSQGRLPTDGAWHHVAVICQRRGLAEVYVDGLPTQLTTLLPLAGSLDSGLPLNIGQDGRGKYIGPGTGIGGGIIDDLGIWLGVISPAQVAAIYFEGSEGLSFDRLPAWPAVFSQPCGQSVTEGLNASFSVVALGDNLNYQWRWNGAEIPNATNAFLMVSNAQLSQAGNYIVVVTNASGAITSNPALLTVNPRPLYVLTNGLVAHLPFDGSYNDVSGNGYNGLAIGMPGMVAGKVGSGALSFTTLQDGSSFNYLSLGTNLVKQIATNDFTLAFWISLSNFVGNPPLLGNQAWANTYSPGITFAVGTGGVLSANLSIGIGAPLSVSGGVIADGNWHHVAMTYQRGRLSVLYQDGQPVATTALVLTGSIDSGFPFNIGQDGRGNYFGSGGASITNGLLDDLGIWQRALARRQVEFIYLQGRDKLTFDLP